MTPDELDAIEARQRAATTMMDVGDVAHDDLPRVIAALREAWAEAELARITVAEDAGLRIMNLAAEVERLRAALALQAESVENAGAAIARVRAQHAPGEDYYEPNGGATMTRCAECDDDWPCATIRALDRVAPMRAWGIDPGEAE